MTPLLLGAEPYDHMFSSELESDDDVYDIVYDSLIRPTLKIKRRRTLVPNENTNITVKGRLSWPRLTMAEAIAANPNSKYPKTDDKIAPTFSLLIEKPALDKLIKFIKEVFLPYCLAQHKAGEKRNALDEKQIDKILAVINGGDWEDQPPYIPIKVVSEKTQPMAPESVAALSISGTARADIIQKAVAREESELAVNDGSITQFPLVLPINETRHELYAGAQVGVTLNLFSFVSAKMPGFSAGANAVVFMADDERFGGGADVDEDALFSDD